MYNFKSNNFREFTYGQGPKYSPFSLSRFAYSFVEWRMTMWMNNWQNAFFVTIFNNLFPFGIFSLVSLSICSKIKPSENMTIADLMLNVFAIKFTFRIRNRNCSALFKIKCNKEQQKKKQERNISIHHFCSMSASLGAYSDNSTTKKEKKSNERLDRIEQLKIKIHRK